MKRIFMTIAAALFAVCAAAVSDDSVRLTSPDGSLVVTVNVDKGITYTLEHDSDLILDKSAVSVSMTDGTAFDGSQPLKDVVRRSVDQTLPTVLYKKDEVRDTFNEMTLCFEDFSLVFRAYDDGMAYRFISHLENPVNIRNEVADFNFPQDWNMWAAYVKRQKETLEEQFFNSFENIYEYCPISDWNVKRLAFLPLMVDGPNGKKVVIAEADLMNYPGMYLHNSNADTTLEAIFASCPEEVAQGGHNNLQMLVKSRKPYIAEGIAAEPLPWRIVAVSEDDVQMADNDMVYRLATPADPQADWSWVKPGKVAWDWWNAWNIYNVDFESGINNDTYKYYIDFASENGIEYVILDEGWAVNKQADLFQVIPEIDLEMLVEYASQRNVGLILWAGYWAFERDMEKVCKHYSDMGIKGFKVDFMDRDDQAMVDFHRRAAEMAAKYKMLVDFHGTYKPTGLHRTYPNVVNFEGVHGLEQMKWSAPSVDQVTYDVTVPYIRMMAGPMDYTQGAMRNAIKRNYQPVNTEAMSQGTRCRQLAQYVIFESPLNMLCDSPSNYLNERECLDFISSVPTVWDETVALCGEVGSHIAMARRSGDKWYVGAMTDWSERTLELDLSFLPEGEYTVELYRDGVNASKAARDYKKEVISLPADRSLTVKMAPAGGFAAVIAKSDVSDDGFPSMWHFKKQYTPSFKESWKKEGVIKATKAGDGLMKAVSADGKKFEILDVVRHRPVAGPVDPGDYILFEFPAEVLPAGSYVGFDATFAAEEGAPSQWAFEYMDGGEWVRGENVTVYGSPFEKKYQLTSLCQTVKLKNEVKGALKMRLIALEGERVKPLADAPALAPGCVIFQTHAYVAAYAQNFGVEQPKDTTSVLCLGNSFTYFDSCPGMLKELAWSQGHYLDLGVSVKGGATMGQHRGFHITRDVVEKGGYEYMILQDQSQANARVGSDKNKYANLLDDIEGMAQDVRKVSPDCKALVEYTWAYPGKEHGGFGTIENFDRYGSKGARMMAKVIGDAEVSPIGEAFKMCREERPDIPIYNPDGYHQTLYGAYLKSCVNCLMLFPEPFGEDAPDCMVPSKIAAYLRSVAERVVLK